MQETKAINIRCNKMSERKRINNKHEVKQTSSESRVTPTSERREAVEAKRVRAGDRQVLYAQS